MTSMNPPQGEGETIMGSMNTQCTEENISHLGIVYGCI